MLYANAIPIVTKGLFKVIRKRRGRPRNSVLLYQKGETQVLPLWGSLYNVTSKVKVEVEEDAEIFSCLFRKPNFL